MGLMSKELVEAVRFICTVDFWIMAVLWTFSLLASYLQFYSHGLFGRIVSYPRNAVVGVPVRPLCIITGATSGLGAAAAYALSKEGFTVVLVGRSAHRLSKRVAEICRHNKDAHLKAFQVDISSIQSILHFRCCLEQWLLESNMHASVQLLINNAGILATSCRITAEGFDEMMATNYMGAFFLTKHLLPLLRNSPVPSRVVNVTSFTHRSVRGTKFDKESVTGKSSFGMEPYPCSRIYGYSKLCLLLFSYELHWRLRSESSCHVSIVAVDPGVVKTSIMREVPPYVSYTALGVLTAMGLLDSPECAVNSILDAALAPPEISGVYFFGGKGRTISSSSLSYDAKLARELWATSCDLFLEAQLSDKSISSSVRR
ncbi:short-chain dehydrogenase TIC 32, chloroplastic-like [Rhodamnia argentea]|uniref:Short-chain dehydrogenase TIC 32, chloroplastic-like n=1 Tax=Rhodamnia argentea TaxID=178133 RepID=A0A8B8PZD9_9MYRT|nr:short-chain dehydrogenase TIC 32, chloroplastic-like [Rhodamnia argentea]XP_030540167.1 short-chain dehydrogenase TIC 32, chloroplastic-like [Rhodamnia argentea]XP_048132011.1 short-chain dehydrogenase TIC 32, chloroplastic-like [Rhodamnia argentea]